MKLDLKNKKAVITGSGRRVGRELAKTFAARGVRIALHCRNSETDARELLEDSQYLIKDVAAFTGWRSQFYFSNSYRKAFGIPPQKQLQNRQNNRR